jgi:NADH-quinone oxidoreductase subunit E
MPLLYLAMAEEGHLSDEGMEEVAEWCEITPAQVLSVASFYTMYKRERTGDYLISCCTSISCMLLGGDDVLHAVEDESGVPHGETDDDGLLSVEHVECLGACGGAPAVQVNYELIEGVTPDKGRELVRWLKKARPEVVNTDEIQKLFGERRSFDWAIPDDGGATGPYPAFDRLGTVRREADA